MLYYNFTKTQNSFSGFYKQYEIFFKFLSIVGAAYLIRKSYLGLHFIKKYFFTKTKNFPIEYGKGWVFITGSSEGIGKSFAKQFALRGCNILLSSRNEEKLKFAQEEIKKLNRNIQVEYLVLDFNKNFVIFDIEILKNKIDKYDISILVNNVGVYKMNFLEKLPNVKILEMINVNTTSVTIVTKICLEKMKKRKHKSLIVYSGSDLTLYKPSFSQVYTASKAYLKALVSCLEQENEGKIDFTYLDIGPVYTPSSLVKIPYKLESDEFAEKSMSQLGNFKNSHGHYMHAIKYILYGNSLIYNLYTKKELKKEFYPKN
jgi:short-subunit dehydrogenase